MSSSLYLATIALQGAAAGVAGELAIRSLFRKQDKLVQVKIGKFMLGIFMALKSILFLTLSDNHGQTCNGAIRVADLFFHIAMVAGDYVLLCRVQSVVPVNWRKRTQALNYILIGVRFLIGIVDVVLIKITVHSTGACNFEDQDYWGIVYTFYDTILDIYVTVSISGILIAHIRSLKADRMKVNKLLYTSVIYHNVFRSVGITITSLISSFFLIMKNREEIIMLIWPIVDTFFVILVGYDSDLTKAIRKLRTRRRNVSSNVPSTLDLGGTSPIPIPSSSFFRPHVKPALPHRHSDSDMLQSPYSAYQHDNYFFDTDVESGTRRSDVYDFINLTGWKSKSNDEVNSPRIHFANSNQISSKKVAGSTPTIIDDDDDNNNDDDNMRNDATVSLVVAGTTSCDTDKTRV